ncbi:beta-beta-alpha zinc fingers domain-containing protein [Dioscorea alata]|uniref:Beta-beta-alpha zinc fingers domain-containing protein n=1 Tax=Dioscorea alata TaxID=55571 RepID=A0ACB7WTH6_DIOAL|nr:beta-beta-alpha zinc fingers domain-containing protein [Dioscorea alata]
MFIEDNMDGIEERKEVEKDNDNTSQVREFSCKFCYRRFESAQALGGHQNYHRAERNALRLVSKKRDSKLFEPYYCQITPPYFSPSIVPFPTRQPPSFTYLCGPQLFQTSLTFKQPEYIIPLNQPWSSCHGVSSYDSGGGGGGEGGKRLKLGGGVNQVRKPSIYDVNSEAHMRKGKYYEEEGKDKNGVKLDLTLHL